MTNKPMLSVERELIQRVTSQALGMPAKKDRAYAAHELRAHLDETLQEFNPEGWSIDHSAGRPILMHNKCSVIEAEQAYGLLELIRAAQHQGEPVAFEVDVSGYTILLAKTAEKAEKTAQHYRALSHTVDIRPLYAEQPAPVAPFSDDTVMCRRYQLEQSPGQNFYHYDLEPVYGSVPVTVSELITLAESAPVAVVVPEHTMRSVMDAILRVGSLTVPTSNQCHALAESLNKVAGLNGVNKPKDQKGE